MLLQVFELLSKTCNALQTLIKPQKIVHNGVLRYETIFRATSYHCKSALQIDQCNTTFTKTPRVVRNGDISGHASTGLAARGQCERRSDRIRA